MNESELIPADRCDRCGARAAHKTQHGPEGEFSLLFCQHHWNEHKDVLQVLEVV